jgi:euchromatic histone-lysine N-methyltransferase
LGDEYKDVPEQPEYCIDAGSCGSVARYINHSCEPNLFVQCVLNDHHDLSRPHIWFCAADTIHPLEVFPFLLNIFAIDPELPIMGRIT